MAMRILSSIRNLFRRRRVEEGLREELQSTVALLTEEKRKEVRSESEARRRRYWNSEAWSRSRKRCARRGRGVFWTIS